MKYLILLSIALFSLNSIAESGAPSVNFGKECRRIVKKASKVNSNEISHLVESALRSCHEMPNREAVLRTLEETKSAPLSTRFELLRRLSTRLVVYVENDIFGKDIEDITGFNDESNVVNFERTVVGQFYLNEIADLIGIKRFSYAELRKRAGLENRSIWATDWPGNNTVSFYLTTILFENYYGEKLY